MKSKSQLRRDSRLVVWLAGGERGISSNTIVEVLTGLNATRGYRGYPHDPDDLRRCSLLLRQVPSLRGPFFARFPRAARSAIWTRLVKNWVELTSLLRAEMALPSASAPKTYQRMREIIEGKKQ